MSALETVHQLVLRGPVAVKESRARRGEHGTFAGVHSESGRFDRLCDQRLMPRAVEADADDRGRWIFSV